MGLVHFAATGPPGLGHRVDRFGDLGREAVRLAALRVALAMLLDRLA